MSARAHVLLLFICLLGFYLLDVGTADCYQCVQGHEGIIEILLNDTMMVDKFLEGVTISQDCTILQRTTRKCPSHRCIQYHAEQDHKTLFHARNCAPRGWDRRWEVDAVHLKGEGEEAGIDFWLRTCEGDLCNDLTVVELKEAGGSTITILIPITTAIIANILTFF
ncbi:unnamed protein product, partial [Mesorhabditis spiculigera]